ncbi:MAG TPA: transcription termination factor NusA [Thermoanaerobaculia bacterium]|nr:transcription termination factor NusA [Thermoanaerobaculia bacterium]
MFSENVSKDIRALAHEKAIDVERVFEALEDALATAAKKYYKTREPIETILDRNAGGVEVYVVKEVVESAEQVEDPIAQLTLDQARELEPTAEVGGRIRLSYITKTVVDLVDDPLTEIRTYEARKIDSEVEPGDTVRIPLTKPPEELGRIAAQSAKQVLYQKVREAEREKVYVEFANKLGELENGYVKRFERGDMIVDLNGKTEGIIPRSQQSRAERYSQGDRIKAVIIDVHTQPKGPQIVLSRTDPKLLIKLFEMEVPEIYDGTVVIKGAVREPGERAKIAVASRERDVDPVGACVGMKGSRVQSIIRELRGEKIDIIPWNEDIVIFAQNSLAPAKITRVSVTSDEQAHRPNLDVIVDNDQLSLAIGKRGLNVRLAAELISAKIDIKSEEEVKDEVADALSAMLQVAMAEARAATSVADIDGIDPEVARLLDEAGYDDLDSVLNASVEDLTQIEGIDEETAAEAIELARTHEQMVVEEDQAAFADEEEEEESDEEYEESDELEAEAETETETEEDEELEATDDVSHDETSGEPDTLAGEPEAVEEEVEQKM